MHALLLSILQHSYTVLLQKTSSVFTLTENSYIGEILIIIQDHNHNSQLSYIQILPKLTLTSLILNTSQRILKRPTQTSEYICSLLSSKQKLLKGKCQAHNRTKQSALICMFPHSARESNVCIVYIPFLLSTIL